MSIVNYAIRQLMRERVREVTRERDLVAQGDTPELVRLRRKVVELEKQNTYLQDDNAALRVKLAIDEEMD